MTITPILKKFGLNDKEIKIYLTLLKLGPTSVRKIAEKSGINRGTSYDVLKNLRTLGLVTYYHKATKQFFVAEDPHKLLEATDSKIGNLNEVKKKLNKIIPELKSLHDSADNKPVVKYYEGLSGVRTILQDVLESTNKEYFVFSSTSISPYLYKAFPSFTKQRIKKNIKVKVISIGAGGELAKLSERKWLSKKEGTPTYILIYSNKVAMISINQDNKPLGLITEDKSLYHTQLQLFNYIWQTL
ncbi:TrmB family transcriptional regulator [bacterium]|jgi:HTH-type transcriptional regulator, sugar sensing transcriptional regulator|nr:TrmB family transcriptional regulator [bacterium]MBT4335619.1 TrmB family transcriptional regulator [bacterium]MBT4495191.1 TrmB family transcriptional regulator [bacterium]MBT4763686.1 TrmB family transcriptional regulator [bacterium]MBT5401057.1 TrmB family transcriptional regulator [bacterium]